MALVLVAAVIAAVLFGAVVGVVGRLFDDRGPDTYGIGALINALIALALVSVPLGLWKFVEIVLWFLKHLHWSLS